MNNAIKIKINIFALPLLALALAPLPAAAQQQNIGYMGRHAVVTLDGNVNANYGYFKVRGNADYAYDALPVTFSPSLTLEYAVGRRVSLAARAGLQTYATPFSELTHAQDLAVTCRLYGAKNNLGRMAPLGAYVGYGLMVSRQQLDTVNTPNFSIPSDDGGKTDYLRFGIRLEMGRNYIWMDRLVMNIGVNYTLVAGIPFRDKPFSLDHYSAQQQVQNRMSAAAWVTHGIMLHIGIGVLPF